MRGYGKFFCVLFVIEKIRLKFLNNWGRQMEISVASKRHVARAERSKSTRQ